MGREDREALANWLTLAGGVLLFASLFMTWSHQFSASFLRVLGRPAGQIPLSPNAWQVYSAADIVLALLAAGLVGAALVGNRVVRVGAAIAAAIGVAFTVHAIIDPPTNAVAIFNPAFSVPALAAGTTAGVGETVALLALLIALGGLALSFTAD